MRLVRCKKCGTPVMTDSTMLAQMYETLEELNKKASQTKSVSMRNVYVQQASQVKKMIAQVQHRSSELEMRKNSVISEYAELVHYVRSNNLITDEKLHEIMDIARERAKIRNVEDEKAIELVYGEFNNIMVNNTKRDPTAVKALNHIKN